MSDQQHHDNKFMFGFFLGGLIGALIIFFLGTKDGKKMGSLLTKQGKSVLDDLEDRLDQLQEKGKELVQHGRELKDQMIDTLEEKKEEVTQSTVEHVDQALAHIEEMQKQGMETTANLRKKIFKNLPKRA